MVGLNKKSCIKLAKNLQKGDLLLWNNYKFDNGKAKNKIIIVLNTYKYKVIIYVLTTSKTVIYNKDPYAAIDTIRIPAKKIKCFPLETVIDVKHCVIKTIKYLSENFYNNNLKLIGRLPNEEIENIDNCVKKAITLNQEIKNLILY